MIARSLFERYDYPFLQDEKNLRFYYELSFLRSEGAKILPEAVWM